MAEKNKDLLQEGPGPVKDKPQVASWRGDSGTSDAKGAEETKDVEYDR